MTLAPGVELGPYEILAPLGAGGMGEVYRARDTRLEREVAIKVLPEHLSHKPDARERFEREARAISSLSHPNICHLYDIGQQDGTSYLVMEYLEGETLANRLHKGSLPQEQVLKVGMEICEGLERAHRSGVVHRDLKPGNIMLTKSGAKLMDFGLAKTAVAVGAGSASASLATMSQPLTAQGTIVGTFQYMSPEQIEGKEADVRSDIFALGAVLYEMITGTRAFEGKTTASMIAAILAAEPKPISTVQPMSPAALGTVVKACLAKDPDERLQTVHDVKLQLKWIESDSKFGVPGHIAAERKSWDRVAWLLAALLVLLLIAGGVTWWFDAHQTPPPMYFSSAFPFPANDVALSQDGRMVAMVAYSDQANKYMIWTQDVGGRRATVVPGTEDAFHPFWSPDGRSIGFFSQGKLKKVDIFSGRSAQVICDAPHGRGGAWNRDGVILFSPDGFAGLNRVSSAGGTPTAVTQVEASRSEFSHRWPVFLPDGRHYLYLAANFSGKLEKNEIFLGSLDSSEKRPIVSASSNAAYADPGYLLYLRDNALVAQRFDSHNYVLSGEPHNVSDEVQYFPLLDLAVFDVAGKGTLVVQTGKGANKSQMVWFDRNGRQVGTVGKPSVLANPRISPDGRRVVVDQTDSGGRHDNIWIYGVGNEVAERFTFSAAADQLPIWSPDDKQIVFGSNQKFHFTLYHKNSDGSGSPQEIADLGAEQQGPWDWSRDGKYLLVMRNAEVWYLSAPDWQAKPFLQGKAPFRNAQFSPDGKWVAYSTNESGSWEVYATPFPSANSKWQVSRGGGEEPRWRRDGKELFYLSGEGKMMAVALNTASNFEAGPPVALFQTHTRQQISFMDVFSYDVTGDGQRFLINTKVNEPDAAPLSVILNWASEMEK
jgi:serine/threonine protein kinase/Tol biopolymer transport system component